MKDLIVKMMLRVQNPSKLSLKEKENLEATWMIWMVQMKTMEKTKIVKKVMILLNFQVKPK
jgi:hypothetical protein